MEDITNLQEEEKIAKDLSKYLHKEDFINRSLASIDRILELYFTLYNKSPSEEKEVISFLFKYFKENKDYASILFRHIKNSREKYNIIRRLYNEHRYDFNFDIISSEVFLTSFDLVQFNDKLKRALSFLAIFIPLLIIALITSRYQVSSLKLSHKEQLNEKYLLLQKEISAKEKLESEMKTLKQNYEKDVKTKEQLGTEMSILKQNLQEEIKTIKQHFENELTTVKEKQQEASELSTCKDNLQQEKLNKIQIESELLTCKEKFEKEQINKMQTESELNNCKEELSKEKMINQTESINQNNNQNQKKRRFEFMRKINPYMLLFFEIDITVFTIIVLVLVFSNNRDIENKYCILLPFILEMSMNFQFLFDTNSTLVYFVFSVVFALSFVSVLFFSNENNFCKKKILIIPFVYTTLMATYKYMLVNAEMTIWNLVISLLFVSGSITIFTIHETLTDIGLALFLGVTLFIYSSCIDRSPFFISNAIFIILILLIISDCRFNIFHCVISFVFSLFNYYALILWKKHDKIYYISITSLLIVEIILCFYHRDDNDLYPLFLFDILFSLLALHYNLFVFIFITCAFICLSFFLISEINKSKVCVLYIFFVSAIQFVFSSIKAWKWYHITDFFKKLLHK